MARLPQPGADAGNWGDILNDYLAQAHKADGTLKTGSVTVTAIADATISEAKLDPTVQSKLNSGGGTPGSTGATGPAGAQGAAGAAGAVGATGATGPQGIPGTNGTNGAVGATGVTGATGAAGAQGATGPAGPNSATDLSVTSDTTTVTIASSTGNDAAVLTAATTSAAGVLSAADKTTLNGVQGQLDQRPVYVFVSTGTETRPTATHVIWVGGTTRPTNTLAGDLWLSETT